MASLELVGEARPTRARGAGQRQALRLMAIRQARLEPLALSASCHGRMVNGCAAASGEERIDKGKGDITDIDRLRGEGVSRTCRQTLDAGGLGVKKALFSDHPFSLLATFRSTAR